MSNQITPTSPSGSPAVIQQRDINIPGDGHTIVANAGNVNNTMFIMQGAMNPAVQKLLSGEFSPNYECYNLFVVDSDAFTTGWFLISKETALTQSTSEEIFRACRCMDSDAICRVRSYPAIFASKNRLQGGKTEDDHMAYFGYVAGVELREENIQIECVPMNPIPQNLLISLSDDLGIEYASCFCEFDRPHWSIKNINLVNVLNAAGYRVFTM